MREQGSSHQAEQQSQRSVKAHAVDQGVTVLSYLIGGVLVYGGLGWLGDHFFGTKFLLPLGIILGAALAVYAIIKRFGKIVSSAPVTDAAAPAETDRPAADDDH
jgi:F0F1-type ATP synthase assembly protein I